MSDRYFLETPPEAGQAHLTGAEAHHLTHVMRLKAGSEVRLFDGRGGEFQARIERVGRDHVELAILSHVQVPDQIDARVVIAVSLPKGDRQRWLVEKLVELGASELVPLETARGVAVAGQQSIERLGRTVIEATKQCGRSYLMAVRQSVKWSQFVKESPPGAIRLIAEPGAPVAFSEWLVQHVQEIRDGATWMAAVGPEGGWTDDELQIARDAGWQPVNLGPHTLRIETAALVLAALPVFVAPRDSPNC